MKIISEKRLRDFHCWAGAIDTMNRLTYEQMDILEDCIEDIYPDGMSDTALNDFLWFEQDAVAGVLGFDSWEELTGEEVEDGDIDEG